MQTMNDFEIKMDEAAITFSKDGTINLFLPKYDEDYQINPQSDPHVFTAVAIMTSMQDDDFNMLINNKITMLLGQAEAAAGGTGCGGGCGGCKTNEPEEGCCDPGDGSGNRCGSVTPDTDSEDNDPHGG